MSYVLKLFLTSIFLFVIGFILTNNQISYSGEMATTAAKNICLMAAFGAIAWGVMACFKKYHQLRLYRLVVVNSSLFFMVKFYTNYETYSLVISVILLSISLIGWLSVIYCETFKTHER